MKAEFYLNVARILIRRGENETAEWYMNMYQKMKAKEEKEK